MQACLPSFAIFGKGGDFFIPKTLPILYSRLTSLLRQKGFPMANTASHLQPTLFGWADARDAQRAQLQRDFDAADRELSKAESDHHEAQAKGSACPTHVRERVSQRLATIRQRHANLKKALRQH